jgi:hypothetical protein
MTVEARMVVTPCRFAARTKNLCAPAASPR